MQAVDSRKTPIVVDRCNGLNVESYFYACYARNRGYVVELHEPKSRWWLEIRDLLENKELHRRELDYWAEKLSKMNECSHRTPASAIRECMDRWICDLSVENILSARQSRVTE